MLKTVGAQAFRIQPQTVWDMVFQIQIPPSAPAPALESQRFQGILLSFDPYADPYRIFAGLSGHLADKLLHALGGLLAHLLGDMAVYVQGEAGGGVAQVALDGFDIVAALNGGNRVAVT